MNDAYYVVPGERPDLAALEVNPPEGYIGDKILPIVPTVDKSGTVYYATLTADSAAQTGRVAAVAPTATQISDSNTTFSTAEAMKRAGITPDEAKQMGGLEKAAMVGAKWAKRQVMAYMEADVRDTIMGSSIAADYHFDPAKLMTQMQTALQAVRLYEGKSSLVASTAVLKGIVQAMLNDATWGATFSRTIAGASPAQAASGMSFAAWLNALQMFLGVDQVLAGDDTIWNATAVAGRFVVAKLDDGTDELSHKWKPVLGKNFQFMPDGKNPWVIQANANRDTINNTFDAVLWFDTKILNLGASKVFDGVATV